MNVRACFGVSALISLILTIIAYLLPFTLLLYYFAPGFWLGDLLPVRVVNVLGGYLFPVLASALFWTFLIFGVCRLLARGRSRR
jgi:hypothetical protein